MAMQLNQHLYKNAIIMAKNNSITGGRCMSSKIFDKNRLVASTSASNIHLTPQRDYPQAELLPLPSNIDATESEVRFSPQRTRDISANAIYLHPVNDNSIDITVNNTTISPPQDPHVRSYDCNGAISLNSVMQSQVPEPFSGSSKSHLNMPGGQWEQSSKYMSSNLQATHYTKLRQEVRSDWSNTNSSTKGSFIHQQSTALFNSVNTNWQEPFKRNFSLSSHNLLNSKINEKIDSSNSTATTTTTKVTESLENSNNTNPDNVVALTRKEKLKKAVKEYGSTVLIFHVGISLISLGSFYLLVSSGLDVIAILERIGIAGDTTNKLAAGTSTFVIAYAIHKIFAPVRISITLGSTPFIVRYLRKRGFLKPPKPSNDLK